MPIYTLAGRDVYEVIERVVERYHPQLRDVGVTVDCLMAFPKEDANGDDCGPSLSLHGYACAAIVRVISYKNRVAGRGDCEISLDARNWEVLDDEERDALIDHELTHFELMVDAKGMVKRDDLDRPRIRMRRHDHQYGWFDSVARRHGRSSAEFQQADKFFEEYRQQWLPFADNLEEV